MPSRLFRGWRRVGWAAGVSLATVMVVGVAIMANVRADLLAEAERDLVLLMTLRRAALEEGLDQTRSEMALWSDFGGLKESTGLYAAAWDALGEGGGDYLRDLYVDRNPYPPEERHRLADAGDGSAYSALHAERRDRVEDFLEIHDYYDLFMIDPDGNVLYSYFKEPDFGTNLRTGPYAESGLARVFEESVAARDGGHVAFADFARYAPSGDAPSAFVGSPVHDDDGRVLGVLAAQISAEAVNQIMRFDEGMGETGETYVVGEDLLMRSDSRFSDPSTILEQTVDTESVRRAFAGETGVNEIVDYRGEDVLSAFGLMDLEGLRWAVVAEKDTAEILAPARALRRTLLLTGAAIVLLVSLATVPTRDRPDWLRAPELGPKRAAR